ncbi:MAG: prepilin peptidase, partial [Oscillospiraceae bacterium]|nr:prepilin peptidase [Oscillospiraceae bacterium]
LMAACGLFLGWKVTLLSTAIAMLLGGIYGIILLLRKKAGRRSQFAFGPFLCIGMAVGLPYGQQLLDWYLTLFF